MLFRSDSGHDGSAIPCEDYLINQRQTLCNVTQDTFPRYELERCVPSLHATIASTSQMIARAAPICSRCGFAETSSDDTDNDNDDSSSGGHCLLAVATIFKVAPSIMWDGDTVEGWFLYQ